MKGKFYMSKLSEEQMIEIVKGYKLSGLSKREYCQKEGLKCSRVDICIRHLRKSGLKVDKKGEIRKISFSHFKVADNVHGDSSNRPIQVRCGDIELEFEESVNLDYLKEIICFIKEI